MPLEQNLRNLLIEQYTFKKINNNGTSPYFFQSWGTDEFTGTTFYYWFWNKSKNLKNKKRVILKEFETFIKSSIILGTVTRRNFNLQCHQTNQSGPCGFAVMLSIITDVAGTTKIGSGVYRIIDTKKLKQLLN
jgi:hypothetical protein